MYKTENLEEYLCQGDIILNFTLDSLQNFEPIDYYKGILILSFTCDLKNNKLEFINYCPIYSLHHRIIEFYEFIKNNAQMKKEIKKRASKNAHSYIKGKVINLLSEICNYKKQNIFFLKGESIFIEQSYANLEQIYSLSSENVDQLKIYRVASLKNPWVEKLGFMLGFCFNRVATDEISKSERDALFENKYKTLFTEFVDNVIEEP